MDEPEDVAAQVWENVQTLMQRAYGGDNITRLGRETGIKQGGAQRLKEKRDIGIGMIARVAAHFKIDAWQLLAPNLGDAMRLSTAELMAIRKMRDPIQPRSGSVISLPQQSTSGGGLRKTMQQKRRPSAHEKEE